MSQVWDKLETHVVNDVFPLQRCVGSTDHSGVYLTQATKHAPSAVALKLVPYDPQYADTQLAQWRAAVELSHPHLLKIFEAGECEIDEQRFLYARMEFADQTLVQVLEQRALSEEEAREFLGPALDVLDYLHREGWVHGGLKPSNVLVVGNQLKLASDTVRAIDDRDAAASVAADIRALGATLFEALTRLPPSGIDGAAENELPPAVPVAFRRILSRCASADPGHRPSVAELQAWLNEEAPAQEAPKPESASPTRLVIRIELPPSEERISAEKRTVAPAPRRTSSRMLPSALGAIALGIIAAFAYRKFSAGEEDAPPPEPPGVEAPPAVLPATAPVPAAEPVPAAPAAPPPAAANEVIPTISASSLETIRGTVRVTVRATVDPTGAVISATPIDGGPSRFFERRALEAARQWTFPPVDSEGRRSMRIRFNFTRSGVTASSEPLP